MARRVDQSKGVFCLEACSVVRRAQGQDQYRTRTAAVGNLTTGPRTAPRRRDAGGVRVLSGEVETAQVRKLSDPVSWLPWDSSLDRGWGGRGQGNRTDRPGRAPRRPVAADALSTSAHVARSPRPTKRWTLSSTVPERSPSVVSVQTLTGLNQPRSKCCCLATSRTSHSHRVAWERSRALISKRAPVFEKRLKFRMHVRGHVATLMRISLRSHPCSKILLDNFLTAPRSLSGMPARASLRPTHRRPVARNRPEWRQPAPYLPNDAHRRSQAVEKQRVTMDP